MSQHFSVYNGVSYNGAGLHWVKLGPRVSLTVYFYCKEKPVLESIEDGKRLPRNPLYVVLHTTVSSWKLSSGLFPEVRRIKGPTWVRFSNGTTWRDSCVKTGPIKETIVSWFKHIRIRCNVCYHEGPTSYSLIGTPSNDKPGAWYNCKVLYHIFGCIKSMVFSNRRITYRIDPSGRCYIKILEYYYRKWNTKPREVDFSFFLPTSFYSPIPRDHTCFVFDDIITVHAYLMFRLWELKKSIYKPFQSRKRNFTVV